jgi:hypothetical protein
MKFTKPVITAAAAVGISIAMAATASAYSRGPMRGSPTVSSRPCAACW